MRENLLTGRKTMKNNFVKVALLSSVTTGALVYVLLEWRPFRSETLPTPEVTWAAGAKPAPTEPLPAALQADRGFGSDEQNNIEIYRKYSAGVVNITSTSIELDFFRLEAVPVEAGSGSGVVIDDKGHVITNFHVIEPSLRGGEMIVTLADKSQLTAKLVGMDPSSDLAVIRIELPRARPPAIPLGTSKDLVVGQKVLAIGNPFGYQRTLTTGIISATGRSIQALDGRIIENVIQTDAAINSGNSGGPLLNSKGEIIGINSAIFSPAQSGNIGIGFAIPADTVRRVVEDLIAVGYVRRPYHGVTRWAPLDRYPPTVLDQLGIPVQTGIMLLQIAPGSPAARAGIRVASRQVVYGRRRYPVDGDILIAFDGHEIASEQDLWTAMDRHKAGDKVTFTIQRGSQKLEIPVVLQEAPPPQNR
jgi:putative serine protease PepD